MPRWDGVQELIGEVQALKSHDERDYAQDMLNRLYKYVAPIMRRRKYRVHKLAEFLPGDRNLLGLNVNRGQRINIRLRHSDDTRQFLSFESVLETMLHELCHNTYGAHDRRFFALFDELNQEMQDMIARGFTGDAFIGAGVGRKLPNLVGARAASTLPFNPPSRRKGRGRKLGGSKINLPQTRQGLRDLALKAIERRLQADKHCHAEVSAQDLAAASADEESDGLEIVSAVVLPSPAPTPDTTTHTQKPMAPAGQPIEVISLLSDED